MRQRAALSDYRAAERILLAWIRTGLALMGFGFVVARCGLRIIAGVRHRPDRSWSNRECLCRMAPPPIGPGIGSRPNGTLSSFDRGCGDCFLSSISRAGNGD